MSQMNGLLYYNMSLGSTNAALEVKNIEKKKKKKPRHRQGAHSLAGRKMCK